MGAPNTTNLSPNAVVSETGPWTATPSGTILANLSDADTSTGITTPSGTGGYSILLGIPGLGIDVGTAVLGVEVFGDVSFSSFAAGQTITARLLLNGTPLTGQTWTHTGSSGHLSSGKYPLTPAGKPLQFKNDGSYFTAADIGNLQIEVTVPDVGGSTTFASRIWTLGLKVYRSSRPGAPTIAAPLGGSTVNTDTPQITVDVLAHPQDGNDSALPGLQQWVEHEFATDAGFSANLTNVNYGAPPAGVSNSDSAYTHTVAVPDGQALVGPSAWYLRARTVDNFGSYSEWAANATTFAISHPPTATGLTPTGAQSVVVADGAVTLDWTFSDTSSTDAQTAYQVVVERNSDGVIVIDTGKVSSGTQQHDITVPVADRGIELRWRVRLWDTRDSVSAYSANQLFVVWDPATLTITSPAAGATVGTPLPTITATFTSPAGNSIMMANLQVVETATGDVAYESGWVSQNTASMEVGTPLEVGTNYTATLKVLDSSFRSTTATVAFSTSWVLPETVDFVIDGDRHVTHGHIELLWSGSVADPNWTAWRIYRRVQGDTRWELLEEVFTLTESVTYQDWLAASGVTYEYTVVQVTDDLGAPVESARVIQAATAGSTDYWLIHPTDELLTFRLHHVTEDTYTDEFESETINLIGVGRHTDYGTHWGVIGSLTAQVYDFDGASARELQLALRRLKDDRSKVYLRTPFGDIWQVSTGNIDTQRVPGVGVNEYVSITLPYTEVA